MLTLNVLLEQSLLKPAKIDKGIYFKVVGKNPILDSDEEPITGFVIVRRRDRKYTLSFNYDVDVPTISDLIAVGLWDTNPVREDLRPLGVHQEQNVISLDEPDVISLDDVISADAFDDCEEIVIGDITTSFL